MVGTHDEADDIDCSDLLTEGLDELAQGLVARAFAHLWRGVAPSFEDLGDPAVAAELFARLSSLGRCEIDAHGHVIGAHGLTQKATAHRIVHGQIVRHTWCGFDAVAIPGALGINAVAATSCPRCGSPIEVHVTHGEPRDDGHIIWIPGAYGDHLIADFCSRSNVFCSPDHLAQWRAGDHGDGDAITVARAASLGRDAWSDIAAGADVWKELGS